MSRKFYKTTSFKLSKSLNKTITILIEFSISILIGIKQKKNLGINWLKFKYKEIFAKLHE